MDCSYCYEKSKLGNSNIDVEKTLNSIYKIDNTPCIEIIGGEPLLNWPTFMEICKSVKGGTIMTTTNGTLLTRDKIRFLKENGVLVGISYDGKTHDVYRNHVTGEGTEQIVKNNILIALEEKLDITINIAFQKANAIYVYYDVVDLINIGVSKFKINTVNNSLFKADDNAKFSSYNRLMCLASDQIKIDLDTAPKIGSVYDHYYYYDDVIKHAPIGSLGKWELVGWQNL